MASSRNNLVFFICMIFMSSWNICKVQVHGQEVEFIDDDLNDNVVEEAQVVDDYVVEEEKNVDLEDGDAGDDGSDVGGGVAETEEVTVKIVEEENDEKDSLEESLDIAEEEIEEEDSQE